MLLLVKLQAFSFTILLKVTLFHGWFFTFFKLYKWYQIAQNITYSPFFEKSNLFSTAKKLLNRLLIVIR